MDLWVYGSMSLWLDDQAAVCLRLFTWRQLERGPKKGLVCVCNRLKQKGKKAEHLYNALYGIQTTLKRSGMDRTVLPAINTMPAFTS